MFISTMTDLHPKLPSTSFFLWLFGRSSRAHLLGLVLLFVHMPWPDQCVVAQAQPSARLAVGHDFWGFKDNAPQGTQAIAQTSDGFLWFGTPLGLYRFDGTRFEPGMDIQREADVPGGPCCLGKVEVRPSISTCGIYRGQYIWIGRKEERGREA